MDSELAAKYRHLKDIIGAHDSVIVAFSGGVDSSLVAHVAAEVLGERALAVTSGSRSLKRSDLKLTEELAQRWGMRHEVIVTDDYHRANEFVRRVNSSTVGVNCSTAFADGFRLGLGAEIGISTSKLHAYGPMGLEGLTAQKFVLFGEGQLRE